MFFRSVFACGLLSSNISNGGTITKQLLFPSRKVVILHHLSSVLAAGTLKPDKHVFHFIRC